MEDPTKGYEPMSPRTREEFIAALEEHDRQQRFQRFSRQLAAMSPLNRYQSVKYRATQRVSLRAMAIWLLGHNQPMMAERKFERVRLDTAELAM